MQSKRKKFMRSWTLIPPNTQPFRLRSLHTFLLLLLLLPVSDPYASDPLNPPSLVLTHNRNRDRGSGYSTMRPAASHRRNQPPIPQTGPQRSAQHSASSQLQLQHRRDIPKPLNTTPH